MVSQKWHYSGGGGGALKNLCPNMFEPSLEKYVYESLATEAVNVFKCFIYGYVLPNEQLIRTEWSR